MTPDDLSALADATAAATGGAVSVMDPHGYVVAYSSLPGQPIDEVRRDGILGKRIPEKYFVHHEDSAFRSERTVRAVNVPGTLPRLAIAVGTDTDHLGSIWSIMPEQSAGPPDPAAVAALTRAAEAAVPLLLARRSPSRSGRERVWSLLSDENSGSRDAGRDYIVIAAELTPPQPDSAVDQLAGLLELTLGHGADSGCAVREQTVYFLRQLDTELQPLEPFVSEVELVRQRAAASLGVTVSFGISALSRRPHSARVEARSVLDVMPGQGRTTTYRQVQVQVRLAEIRTAIADLSLSIPAVDDMVAHDAAEGTTYADTVLALLDHESNVAVAAASMYLHANTFRYRIRRTRELFGLDLDDADTRLLVWVRLRLQARPSS